MSLDTWLAFTVATSLLLIIPGPTILLVVSYALSHGRRSGWATVPGVALGDFTAMTVSLAGVGALMAASASLFTLVKLIGAAYLIWLGIRLWRSDAKAERVPRSIGTQSTVSMFRDAWVVTALNPKGIVFFIAFVPQFIDQDARLLPQFALLVVTFVTLAALNVAIWAIVAGQFSASFQQPRRLRWINRLGGLCLITAALLSFLL